MEQTTLQPGPNASPAPCSNEPFPAAGPTSRASPPGPAASRPTLGADAELLEAAAWLHDIGYLPELAATGLHGLDGARYLRDVQHAEPVLCRLVAHHSCAVIEAEERGLADVLTREFAPPPQPLADALTFCDMTTSPDGEHVQVTPPPGRDPRPLRLRPPGQPLDPPRHPAHPGGRRPGPRPSRPATRQASSSAQVRRAPVPRGNARSAAASTGPWHSRRGPRAGPTAPRCSPRCASARRRSARAVSTMENSCRASPLLVYKITCFGSV